MWKMFAEIRDNSVNSLQVLLNSNPSLVSVRDADLSTPLHVAASLGRIEIASLLLDSGEDVNAIDINSSTPLINAIGAHHINVAQLLLDNKADTEIHLLRSGRTALHIAALNDDLDAVEMLLSFHADPHALDFWGEGEPVDVAIEARSQNVLNQLISYVTPELFVWIMQDEIQLVSEYASRGSDTSVLRPSGSTALHWAASFNTLAIASKIIDMVPVNNRNNLGKTALMYAVWLTHGEITSLLLAKGSDPNIADKNGYTALSWAARDDQDIQIIDMLLENGADPNFISTMNRESPIHTWAQYERPDVIGLLLQTGAHTDNKDADGRTPLHVAAENCCYSVVEELIAAGAMVDERDEEGHTAEDIAVLNNNVKMASLLHH